MILNRVVSASRKHLSHFSPLVAVGRVRQKQNPLLVRHPLHLQNTRIEMIVPTLAALLTEPSLDKLGNERPSLRTVLFDQFTDEVVLLLSPRLFPQKFRFIILRLGERVAVILLRYLLLVDLLHHATDL